MTGSVPDLVRRVQQLVLDTGVEPGAALTRVEPLAPMAVRAEVVRRVTARRHGLGPLEPLFADPDVSEIMVNGPGPVWVERHGSLSASGVTVERAEIDHVIERLLAPIGRRVDQRSPCVDGRLADGSRVHVAVPPVALDGPYVTIRRFVARSVRLADVADAEPAALLAAAVRTRRSIVVSGGTGAGKTTLLNTLAALVAPTERIVTVEDAAELRLEHPHVVRLETRPASAEGVGAVPLRELVRNALRMRPDRVVVGEVRGAEAYDLVQALNTGHRGCLSTVHANSGEDALGRIGTLALMGAPGVPHEVVRSQLASALDLVVQVERSPTGLRRVVEVLAVTAAGPTCCWRAGS